MKREREKVSEIQENGEIKRAKENRAEKREEKKENRLEIKRE